MRISTSPASLYLHIPFCRHKCAYCDFNSYAGLSALYARYVDALSQEVALYAREWPDARLRTIYVGGGTPTALLPELLLAVLDAAGRQFQVAPGAEVTVEANPGTLDAAYLASLRKAGVKRLSLGVQSLDDALLKAMGRIHSAQEAKDTVAMAKTFGLANINLDLIYGLPRQTMATWQATLAQACDLEPTHLSLYALTVHEGTPMCQAIECGELPAPDDDLAADMYEWAMEALEARGYAHYEISNWARGDPPAVCEHNLTYWRDEPYLGLGAGAHGYLNDRRYWNIARPDDYICQVEAGGAPIAGSEEIDLATEMSECVILGLRLMEGIAYERFRVRFGRELRDVFGKQIGYWSEQGLLCADDRGIRLTKRGYLLGNQVFQAFLPG